MKMKNNIYYSWKKVLFLTFVPLILASFALSNKLSFSISQVFQLDPLSFQKVYYGVVNRDSTYFLPIDDPSHYITIININHIDSRRRIADIIKQTCINSPKVVGIDMIFDSRRDSDDDYLESVVREHSEHLVLACSYNASGYTYSFFGKDSLLYGVAGSFDPLKVSRFIGPSHEEKSFPFILAEKSGNLASDVADEVIINYSSRKFDILSISDTTDLSSFFGNEDNLRRIRNQIVIINDLGLQYDNHQNLFLINGSLSQSGTILIAYQLFAVMDKQGRMSPATILGNILFGILFTFIYALVFCLIDSRIKNRKDKVSKMLIILLKVLILYITVFIIIFGAMHVMMRMSIIPNSVFFLLSILFVDTANYIYGELIKQ